MSIFFCETIDLPSSFVLDEGQTEEEGLEHYISEFFDNNSFSPYPQDQLAWGFYGSIEEKKGFHFCMSFN